MQNKEQEKGIREQLREKLDNLAKITPESLVRTDDLGRTLDFRGGVEVFKRTLKLFGDLKGANLDDFPDQRLNNLMDLADTAIASLENIKNFEPAGQPNPGEARDSLIREVEAQYINQFNHISQVLPYTFWKGADIENLMGEAKTAVSKAEEEVKKAETASKQIDDILKEAKKVAAEIGVAKYAEIFKSEADSHKEKGRW